MWARIRFTDWIPLVDGKASGDGIPVQTLREATEEFQRQWLRASLARHNAHLSNAAREAGMDKSNFHRLLRRLGVMVK